MVDENRYDKLLQESMKQELRFLNAQLPGKQKPLNVLLEEETPSIICADGSLQLLKRKELEYLSTLIPDSHWPNLMIPLIIEINSGEDKIQIICRGEEEPEVISGILGMQVSATHNRIRIYKAQLSAIRKQLKTTSQYLFSPQVLM